MSPELSTALKTGKKAAELALKIWNSSFTAETKSSNISFDLVTEADKQCEDLIIREIKKVFPAHSFLGEESQKDAISSEELWVIDPIDGTMNFAHRLPHFSISIAYYKNCQPQVGVVINPATNEIFYAEKGKGAYLNNSPIQVSLKGDLTESLISTGIYYDRGEMMEYTLAAIRDLLLKPIHDIRRIGSAALDLAYTACGRLDGYFEFMLSPWDYAAGQLILEEAGGTITNCYGSPLTLKKEGIAASNGLIHTQLLSTLKPHYSKL